jgi:hypothetical protein
MCIRNNAILAYGVAAVCTYAVLPAFLLCRPHPVQASYHRHTVAQFHVDAEHSSKLLCSMGYPSLLREDEDDLRFPLPRGPIIHFTSPGSLSQLKYIRGPPAV